MTEATTHDDPARVSGIDLAGVTAWLEREVDGVVGPLHFQRVGDGRSNLTYRVVDAGGRQLILRRPPLGETLASAHNVAREHLVMSRLHAAGLPVPASPALCEDAAVTGAPFLVAEFVGGQVIATPESAEELDVATRAAASRSLVRTLGDLHAVDLTRAGLDTLRRPGSLAARQLRRWRRQWEASRTRDLPVVERVADRLEAAMPAEHEVSLIHGDYRLDNTIIDAGGAVRAVLDWELCSVGDPLADLGILLAYWSEPGEDVTELLPRVTALPGFLTRAQVADEYARVTGRDLSDLPFYVALARWRMAIITEGIYRRWLNDPANGGPGAGSLGGAVQRLAQMAEQGAAELSGSG
jgi:aminoglycoside phosphotransferase (APT) family kinase protein